MSIQERITEYLDFKDITPYKFCKTLSFSMGYLDKRGAIGTDKYLKIIEYYTDLNPQWLLTGQGEMLKSAGSTPVVQENNTIDYKELADARKETIDLLRDKVNYLEQENAQLKAKLSGYESQDSARVAG